VCDNWKFFNLEILRRQEEQKKWAINEWDEQHRIYKEIHALWCDKIKDKIPKLTDMLKDDIDCDKKVENMTTTVSDTERTGAHDTFTFDANAKKDFKPIKWVERLMETDMTCAKDLNCGADRITYHGSRKKRLCNSVDLSMEDIEKAMTGNKDDDNAQEEEIVQPEDCR
jgi:hypothetical protein